MEWSLPIGVSKIQTNNWFSDNQNFVLFKFRKLVLVSRTNLTFNITVKNAVISPDFMVRKFCGKVQFPHSFRQITQNYARTVPFHKFPDQEIRWNYGILRSACNGFRNTKLVRKCCCNPNLIPWKICSQSILLSSRYLTAQS